MPIMQKAVSAAPAAAILSLILASPSLAQTSQERAACTPDVMRLCASDIPHADRITACLRRQTPALSTACRTVMAPPEGDQITTTASVRRRAAP